MGALPTNTSKLVGLAAGFDDPRVGPAIAGYAQKVAEVAHPDYAPAHATAHLARRTAQQALDDYHQTCADYPAQLDGDGHLATLPDPAGHLAPSARDVADLTDQLEAAHARVRALLAEPALRTLPPGRLETEHQQWATDRDEQAQQERRASAAQNAAPSPTSGREHDRAAALYAPKPSRGISR